MVYVLMDFVYKLKYIWAYGTQLTLHSLDNLWNVPCAYCDHGEIVDQPQSQSVGLELHIVYVSIAE